MIWIGRIEFPFLLVKYHLTPSSSLFPYYHRNVFLVDFVTIIRCSTCHPPPSGYNAIKTIFYYKFYEPSNKKIYKFFPSITSKMYAISLKTHKKCIKKKGIIIDFIRARGASFLWDDIKIIIYSFICGCLSRGGFQHLEDEVLLITIIWEHIFIGYISFDNYSV